MQVGSSKIVIIPPNERGIYNWPITFERRIFVQYDRLIEVEILF